MFDVFGTEADDESWKDFDTDAAIKDAVAKLPPLPEQQATPQPQEQPAPAPQQQQEQQPTQQVTQVQPEPVKPVAPAAEPQATPLPQSQPQHRVVDPDQPPQVMDDPDFEPTTVRAAPPPDLAQRSLGGYLKDIQTGTTPAPADEPTRAPRFVDYSAKAGWGTSHGTMPKVEGMVIHHTAGGGTVDGVVNTLRQRGLSVQFVIDRDGDIYQLTPDGAKARHTRNGWGSVGVGRSNNNMEGVEVIAKNDRDVTEAQKRAVVSLVGERAKKWGYDPKTSVFGHGEVNPGHKEADEGMSSVSLIRGGTAVAKAPVKVTVPSDVKAVLEEAATRTGVDLRELTSVAKQESSFNPNAGAGGAGAKGLFQFQDKTWQFALKKWGDVHGIPSNAQPTNARWNAILGAEYLSYNKAEITNKLGRYKAGESYLGHFMGPTGGPNLIKLAESNPDAPAAQHFPKAAAANHNVFFRKDGTPRTAKEVYDWGIAIGGGSGEKVQLASSGSMSAPAGAIGTGNTLATNSIPTLKTGAQALAEEDAAAKVSDEVGFMRMVGDSFKLDTLTGLYLTQKTFTPDPATIPDAQQIISQWRSAGVHQDIIEDKVPQIMSGDHGQWLFDRAVNESKHRENLAGLGLGGWVGNTLIQIMDPPTLAASIASGGLADYAVAARGLGTIARMAGQGIAGGASNLGIEAMKHPLGDSTALSNPALTLAIGAGLGALGGALGRNPFTRSEASTIAGLAEREAAAARGIQHENSVGAAATANVDQQFLNDKGFRALPDDNAPRTAMDTVRIDRATETRKSELKTTRNLGAALFSDAIGPADKSRVNWMSADRDKAMTLERYVSEMESFARPAFDDWAKEQGIPYGTRFTHEHRFAEAVQDYLNGQTLVGPTMPGSTQAPVNAAVKRAGDHLIRLYSEIGDDLKNALRRQGMTQRSTPGFENIDTGSGYSTRTMNYSVTGKTIKDGGTGTAEQWFRGSLREANPDWDKAFLDRVSKGIAANLQKRANGVWEGFEKAQRGDAEGFKEFLADIGLSQKEIDEAHAKWFAKEASKDANAQRRLVLSEKFVLENFKMKDGTVRNISYKDFYETNPFRVFQHYANWASGRTALMRTRIANEATGEVVVNGVGNRTEWERLIQLVKDEATEKNVGPKALEKDLENLQWGHDRLLGIADPTHQKTYAQVLQKVRDYNVIRLLGQMGFSQAIEHANAVASLGFKAVYSQVPSLRRIIDPKTGQRVHANKLMKEIYAFSGLNGEWHGGLGNVRIDEFGWVPGSGKIDAALDRGKQVVAHASGFNLVNRWLLEGTQRAIAQRFSDMASKAILKSGTDISKLGASQLNRLRSIGLSDGMLKRVLKEVETHREVRQGLFGEKLELLGLKNWTDLEAKANFEQALFTHARQIIQHNDLGNGVRWLSSPLMMSLVQFRGFVVNAWAKQTLFNLHHRDMRSLATVTYSMMLGSMIYALREQVRAAGRSDRDEYLEKKLAPGEIAKGAFQMMGVSSILPMIIDTPPMLAGYNGGFNARSTAQASDVWFGSPVLSLAGDVQAASAAMIQPWAQGYEMSQQEKRALARVLPFGNTIPVMTGLSLMVGDDPERAPRVSREDKTLF